MTRVTVRVALAAVTLGLTTAPGAAQRAARPYRVGAVDAVAVAGLAGLALLPFALDLPDGPPSCAPCDPASLPAIDRGVVGADSHAAGTASDVVVLGVMGGAAFAALHAVPSSERLATGTVLAQTIAASYAVTGWLKVAAERERPVLYGSGAAAAAGDPDNQRSFPSSHTSAAFAAATWYLVASQRLDLPHRGRNAAILFAAATVVGGLRLAAGDHFPTDVLAGAALGAGLGWAVAALHH